MQNTTEYDLPLFQELTLNIMSGLDDEQLRVYIANQRARLDPKLLNIFIDIALAEMCRRRGVSCFFVSAD
jgi:hypothetical protein